MKALKLALLIAILSIAVTAKSQTVTINIQESILYTGLYEASIYVYDNVTNTTTLVGYLKNQSNPISFDETNIDLSGVNLVNDQVNRYRYIAIITRQSYPGGSGSGYTPLIDSGQVKTGYNPITVNM